MCALEPRPIRIGQRREAAQIGRLDGPLLTPADVALLLSVKTSWVYEAARTGNLPCLRIGRHVRFTRQMVEEWLATR